MAHAQRNAMEMDKYNTMQYNMLTIGPETLTLCYVKAHQLAFSK